MGWGQHGDDLCAGGRASRGADLLEFEARQVAEKIAAAGGQALFEKLDVTSESDWQDAVTTTLTAFGKLDLLVNDAGISGTFDPDMSEHGGVGRADERERQGDLSRHEVRGARDA